MCRPSDKHKQATYLTQDVHHTLCDLKLVLNANKIKLMMFTNAQPKLQNPPVSRVGDDISILLQILVCSFLNASYPETDKEWKL